MPTTAAPFALPYPEPSDTADVPYWLQALAERLGMVLATQDNTALNWYAVQELGDTFARHDEIPAEVAAALAADPTVVAAAAAAVDEALADSIEDAGILQAEPLPTDTGWRWALMYATREVALGERTDGTFYPANLGGAPAPVVAPTAGPVVIWGDSLTSGWAGSTSHLANATGATVTALGMSGQDSDEIAARQGGAPTRVTVTDNVIPASGSVACTVTVAPGTATAGVLQGVAGTLSGSTFTRLTAGLPVSCPPGSPLQAGQAYREHWPIFWAGRNSFKTADERAALLRDTAAMMAWTTRPDRALILSIPPWVGEHAGGQFASTRVNLDAANNSLRDAWPGHYLDLSAMLRRATSLEAVGITPTATDLQNIADGVTPESFRDVGDSGHWSDKAYEAAALFIAMTYESKGWT